VKRVDGHFAGLSLTFLLHAAVIAVLVSRGDEAGCTGGGGDADASKRFEDSQTIEASLAFKAVEPKDRQPQKEKKKKYAPDDKAPVIADADAGPRPEAPEHDLKVKPDEVDIASVLKKNKMQNPDLSSTGAEEIPKEGSASGSEWGTENDAKGDPYAGELKGRIHSAWELPALEQGTGEAHGCVKLDKKGKIVDRFVKKKSGNANLDRSVEEALRQAPDMTEPVPDHLIDLMTVKGICFRFKP
jgi:outer membrane biosynthesis protein TonB